MSKPTIWKHMTREEKGAILLAMYEYRDLESYNEDTKTWDKCTYRRGNSSPYSEVAYRVAPERITLTGYIETCGATFTKGSELCPPYTMSFELDKFGHPVASTVEVKDNRFE